MNDDETLIRKVLDSMAGAVREKDVEAMLALCAPDLVVFDLVPPLKHEGTEAVRRFWTTGLSTSEAPLDYETSDVKIETGGDVAFVRSIVRFAGSTIRSTLGLRKLGGRWTIVHQHVSAPFDMASGKALLDLR